MELYSICCTVDIVYSIDVNTIKKSVKSVTRINAEATKLYKYRCKNKIVILALKKRTCFCHLHMK